MAELIGVSRAFFKKTIVQNHSVFRQQKKSQHYFYLTLKNHPIHVAYCCVIDLNRNSYPTALRTLIYDDHKQRNYFSSNLLYGNNPNTAPINNDKTSQQYSCPHEECVGDCWSCGTSMSKCSLICTNCSTIQSMKLEDFPCDYFEMFHMKPTFSIDVVNLEKTYKLLQAKLHPDKNASKSSEEYNASKESSTSVNQAYQILKSPSLRAEYLVRIIFGVNKEEQTVSDPTLMMEIFELRELIEETDGNEDIIILLNKIQGNVEECGKLLQEAITNHDKKTSIIQSNRINYLTKAMSELSLKINE
eukprot:gene4358-6166_t